MLFCFSIWKITIYWPFKIMYQVPIFFPKIYYSVKYDHHKWEKKTWKSKESKLKNHNWKIALKAANHIWNIQAIQKWNNRKIKTITLFTQHPPKKKQNLKEFNSPRNKIKGITNLIQIQKIKVKVHVLKTDQIIMPAWASISPKVELETK